MSIDSPAYNSNPYRIFFPLGTFFALIGGGLWLFTGNNHYPLIFHSQLMVGTFLFSFIAGFLMTAIPRMTGSFMARKFEVNIVLALIILGAILNLVELNRLFYAVECLSYLVLVYFGFTRINPRENIPPSFFSLVFLGILSGIIGSFLLAMEILSSVGHNLFFNGVVLFLVLGIGSRLVPALRGMSAPMLKGGEKKDYIEFGIAGFLIFLSLIGESILNAYVFGIFKAIICIFIAVRHWKVLSFNRPNGSLAYGMWGSSLMTLIGILLKTILPAFGTHWIHLTYIGGFGMMTFTVASRVIISHGGYDLAFEKMTKVPVVVSFLLFVAAITRSIAPYYDYSYLLKWASVFWISGIIIWSFTFVPRCFGKTTEEKVK